MNDVGLIAVWAAITGAGFAFALSLKRRGVATTYVRDLIHVGAASWVFGWRYWHAPYAPIAVTVAAFAGVCSLPALGRRWAPARAIVTSISDADELWDGIVAYTLAFTCFTALAMIDEPYAPACALLALCFGDGLGGLVGRRLGRTRYRVPWGKSKSMEGTLAVALFAFAGASAATWWFEAPWHLGVLLAVASSAAISEALAPRASDNLAVPTAVLIAVYVFAPAAAR